MKTVGKFLAESRAQRKYSLESLETETKIKKEFLDALEKEAWEKLPDYPVVSGFVKSVTKALEADTEKALALLRRDYPPKTLFVNPKPDVSQKFVWSPRLTFFALTAVVIMGLLGYLGFQYARFIAPPTLEVVKPVEGEVVVGDEVVVSGETDEDVTLTVNNQPVLVSENGTFEVELALAADTEEIFVVAVSRSGKETVVHRNIEREQE